MATLQELLAPNVVSELVTQVMSAKNRLSAFWGMHVGGANNKTSKGKYTAWDVFDRTRKTAKARTNDAGPGTRTRQKVGHVVANLARAHELISIPYDELDIIRTLGSNNAEIGSGGEGYISEQLNYLVELFGNFVEALVAGMCRDSLQFAVDGDDWYPVFSGGDITVNYQMPAGNKDQLDMLGGGDIIGVEWGTAGTATPIADSLAVNAAYEELHGIPLKHNWLTSSQWTNVLDTTEVQGYAGTSNTPFERFERVSEPGPDGTPATGYEATLRGLPDVTWHVYDGGLELGSAGTFTKAIADDACMFQPDPTSLIAKMCWGTESVVEDYNQAAKKVSGFHYWRRNEIKPARIELIALLNCLPELYIPKSIAYGTVSGF